MAGRKIQFRRGTTVEHATFTGAQGELTYDTEKKTLVLHDGTTIGGIELARMDAVPTDLSHLTDDGAVLPVQVAGDMPNASDFTTALAQTPATSDFFRQVSFSGNKQTFVVHMPIDDAVATNSGAIYIYNNEGDGTWSFVEKFNVPSQSPGANGGYSSAAFGSGVAISYDGSRIATSGDTHGVNGANQNYGGAIWVLERQEDGTYSELTRIDRPISDDTNMGENIDMSPDGQYISVSGKDLGSPYNAAITVYKFNSGTQTYDKMTGATTAAGSNVSINLGGAGDSGAYGRFTSAINDDGTYVVFGNPEDNTWGNVYGFAAVGKYDGSNWSLQSELRPAALNPPFVDDYGVSVDINSDGSVIAVGANRAYEPTNSLGVGAVYIWRRNGETWTEEAKIYTPDGIAKTEPRFFGHTVRILPDGNTMFALATYTFANATNTAKVYVYTHDNGSWNLAETIDTGYTGTFLARDEVMDVSNDGSLVVVSTYQDSSKVSFFETANGPYYTA